MSIREVEGLIIGFLKNSEPEAIAIKGGWGIGKTYTWRKCLGQSVDKQEMALERYSYVSLFGVNSIADLKYQIFENMDSSKLLDQKSNLARIYESLLQKKFNITRIHENLFEKKFNIARIYENSLNVAKRIAAELFKYLRGASQIKSHAPAVEIIAFTFVRRIVVCLDDVERRGKGLELKDVLGLISFLKEQRGCKVVVLLNDDLLKEEDFDVYNEKVLDYEIKFSSSVRNAVDVVFEKQSKYYKVIYDRAEALKIENIRILKKVKRIIGMVLEGEDSIDTHVSNQVVESIILFVSCHYSPFPNKIPPLDFIAQYTISNYIERGKSADVNVWEQFLSSVRYICTSELDMVLIDAVRNGYVDKMRLRNCLREAEADALGANSYLSFTQEFDQIFLSFNSEDEEVVLSKLVDSFHKNIDSLSVSMLQNMLAFFRRLERQDLVENAVDAYFDRRFSGDEISQTEEFNLASAEYDPYLMDKYAKKLQDGVGRYEIQDLMVKVVSSNGWASAEANILANADVHDYYTFFKSQQGDSLRDSVNCFLSIRNMSNPSSKDNTILSKATEALKNIASESKLNKVRVARYGVRSD